MSNGKHFKEKNIQTILKHVLLEQYLVRWAKILSDSSFGNKLEKIHFIDCFAGQGEFDDGDAGSPKIAAANFIQLQKHLEREYEKDFKFLIHTIEKERNHFKKLEEIRNKLPIKEQIFNYLGTFEEHIENILRKTNGTPALFFIDPYGYKELPMRKISKIMERHSHEVLINVMSYSLVRNHKISANQKALLDYFGLNGLSNNLFNYLQLVKDNELHKGISDEIIKLEDEIIFLYKQQLRNSVHEEIYVLNKRIYSQLNQQVYFHLVFATKKIDGLNAMKDAMIAYEKLKIEEERKYIKKHNLEVDNYIDDLFSDTTKYEVYEYKDFLIDLVKEFGGETISFKQLVQYFLESTPLPFRSDNNKSIYDFTKNLAQTNYLLFHTNSRAFANLKNVDKIVFQVNIKLSDINKIVEISRNTKNEQLSLF